MAAFQILKQNEHNATVDEPAHKWRVVPEITKMFWCHSTYLNNLLTFLNHNADVINIAFLCIMSYGNNIGKSVPKYLKHC